MGGKLVCRPQDDKAVSQKLKTSPSTPNSVRDVFPTPPNSAPRTIPKVPPRWDTFHSPSEHLQYYGLFPLGFTLQKMLLMLWKKIFFLSPVSTPYSCVDKSDLLILRSEPCVYSICSPAHPPPVLDLRAIMDMEASSRQTLGATPKSPGRYKTVYLHFPLTQWADIKNLPRPAHIDSIVSN